LTYLGLKPRSSKEFGRAKTTGRKKVQNLPREVPVRRKGNRGMAPERKERSGEGGLDC